MSLYSDRVVEINQDLVRSGTHGYFWWMEECVVKNTKICLDKRLEFVAAAANLFFASQFSKYICHTLKTNCLDFSTYFLISTL